MLIGLHISLPAYCLTPDIVFERASPSIVLVLVGKTATSVAGQGSGVVVGRDKVITNCHVALMKSGMPWQRITVKRGEDFFHGKFLTGDAAYDTCLLRVSGLNAPAASFAQAEKLRVGQRVYAIGAPSGLELTLTEGLISGIRPIGRSFAIQTSAAISPGSSGGGLFDENGSLVGITSFAIGTGTGLNFAYIADGVRRLVALAEATDLDSSSSTRSTSLGAGRDATLEEKIQWLGKMSERLAVKMLDVQARLDFLKAVHYEANRAGLDPTLVLALIQTASDFNGRKVSPSGAKGYMQIAQPWVDLIGNSGSNLFHLRTNLRFGCTILRHYMDVENGDIDRALGRYGYGMDGKLHAEILGKDGAFPSAVRANWKKNWS